MAFEHVAVLVLAGLQVHRPSQRARGDDVLDEGEPATRFGGADEEPVPSTVLGAEDLAVGRAQDARCRAGRVRGHLVLLSSFGTVQMA